MPFLAKDFTPTFGVSKLCCPVCLELLSLLCPDRAIQGSHNTVSSCSLPEWLSPRNVDQMNMKFAIKLKKVLNQLVATPDSGRRRANSISSHRLSQDSLVKLGASAPIFTLTQYTQLAGIGRRISIISK